MNNTEQFDEWIRGEIESLDTPPADFRQGDVWKKLQAELPPAVSERRFLVSLTFRSGIAAAVAVLVLVGLTWQLLRPTGSFKQSAQATPNMEKRNGLSKAPLALTKSKGMDESGLKKKPVGIRREEKQPEQPLPETPPNSEPKSAPVPVEPVSEGAIAVLEPVIVSEVPKTASVTKTVTKSKFKIVHANQLENYEKAEIAESLEKEAKANGFIVIHWKANTDRTSQTNLTTYLKNKSSKAE
ncbi:MAG: hypothetical protein U0X91_05525 [Spirosomataceae bacterium]